MGITLLLNATGVYASYREVQPEAGMKDKELLVMKGNAQLMEDGTHGVIGVHVLRRAEMELRQEIVHVIILHQHIMGVCAYYQPVQREVLMKKKSLAVMKWNAQLLFNLRTHHRALR